MIFMALNFVLENYFKDVLSFVDQSSDICDKILDCWFLSFNIFFFLWIIQIKQTFIAYDFGALHSVLFSLHWTYSVHIGPLWCNLCTLIYFSPI